MKEYTNTSPAAQAEPVENQNNGSLARVVIFADLLVTLFLVTGMVVDKHSVTISVLSGVTFFASFGGLAILVISGALPAMVINGQNNKTERYLYRLQYSAQTELQRLRVIDPMQTLYTESVQTMQLPENKRFVAPHAETDDSAKREAAAWILQLYGADSNPDPKKVLMESATEKPGRIRVAAPSRPAKQYLLDRHIIHDLGNGYRLNLTYYPTAQEIQGKLL